MDQDKRSLSVDTLSEYVAQMQTSSNHNDSSNNNHLSDLQVDHILLSCTLNAEAIPTEFHAELIPIETPDHVRQVKACTEADLFFLRWVFEGCFDALTSHISQNYPRYKVLRAEAEPDISWAEFREGRRGFLVWLVHTKSKDDPLAALRDLLRVNENVGTADSEASEQTEDLEASEAPEATANVLPQQTSEREVLLARLVAKQVGVVRRQMRQFYKEIEETERQMSQIWGIVSQSGLQEISGNAPKIGNDLGTQQFAHSAAFDTLASKSLASTSAHDNSTGLQPKMPAPLTEYHAEGASEWSVVDEDEDRELTSLSGYESTSDGE